MAIETYDASPAYMEIRTFAGNNDSIQITFPFSVASGYVFSGSIIDARNAVLFTVTGTVSATYIVTYLITSAQNLSVTSGSTYRLWYVQGGTNTKTFMAGPFTVAQNGNEIP